MIKFSKLLGLVFLIFSFSIFIPAQKKTAKNKNQSETPSDASIFKKAINGIVKVETVCDDRTMSQGSGFIIDDDLIVTNKHVVECGRVTIVKLLISEERYVVDHVYFHPEQDLAILKTAKLHGKDNSLKFAPPNSVKVGNPVYVIGNPQGIEGFYSKGNIQRLSNGFIYFDAPLDHGSSGSPVLDQFGRVV
ncbi:MAG TPA: serine protease, partial [Pyrinomonadaceae bacterium]|nr:serine protease [Pyrinomonadaceae bacterium]